MEVNQYAKKLRETHPDFTIALGNEIYLVNSREKGQKYYHFILLAKDAIGHKALRELSSIAWYNLYTDRGERVPTLKSELQSVLKKYPGHVIGTTACMGGELSTIALNLSNAKEVQDEKSILFFHQQAEQFINFCLKVFGEDFYIECAPSTNKEQIAVNRQLRLLAKEYQIKLVCATDSHYLNKEDRWVHKAYLNSKDGDREVDSFYEFARLMDGNECEELLNISFEDLEFTKQVLENTKDIQKKVEFYSLERKQIIPKVEVKEYENTLSDFISQISLYENSENKWDTIKQLLTSNEPQERYWINEVLQGLRDYNLWTEPYLDEIETEADVIKSIGDKLDDCLFAYFNTLKHYIDLFWECGSIIGPGRGSACGALSNYALGITQLDPMVWDLKFWRFLSKERAELPEQY